VEALLGQEGRPAYVVAAGYARSPAHVEDACTWLRRAIERDPQLAGEARADPAFDLIREMTMFKEVLGESEMPEEAPSNLPNLETEPHPLS